MNKQSEDVGTTYILNGVYPTWEQCCEAAKVTGGEGLGGATWFQQITQQILTYRAEFQQYGIAIPPRPSNLPLVCALTNASCILDFGGSSGWCWDFLLNSLPKHMVSSYVVVETEEVVARMTKSGIHKSPVSYLSLKDPIDTCDLLYCNSVLQYFGSNEELLSLIGRTKPDFILLEDVAAKGDEDFFTVQSYRGSAIPYRLLGLKKLLDELLYSGYEELVKLPYASPVLGVIKPFDMGNFPEEKRRRYSMSILLSKGGRQ